MQDFRTVDAWKKAHLLVLHLYRATNAFSRDEIFGITARLRRVATDLPTRLAEAYGKATTVERAVDLRKVIATSNELEYLILLAQDLELWSPEIAEDMMNATIEVRKMVYGLLRAL